jgi:hypothetical protein
MKNLDVCLIILLAGAALSLHFLFLPKEIKVEAGYEAHVAERTYECLTGQLKTEEPYVPCEWYINRYKDLN